MSKTPTLEETHLDTILSTNVYNQAENVFEHNFDFIDSDCGCNSEKTTDKCITASFCLDKSTYEWLVEQGDNRHMTLNTILKNLMMTSNPKQTCNKSKAKQAESSDAGCC